jgi:hypothetical protein
MHFCGDGTRVRTSRVNRASLPTVQHPARRQVPNRRRNELRSRGNRDHGIGGYDSIPDCEVHDLVEDSARESVSIRRDSPCVCEEELKAVRSHLIDRNLRHGRSCHCVPLGVLDGWDVHLTWDFALPRTPSVARSGTAPMARRCRIRAGRTSPLHRRRCAHAPRVPPETAVYVQLSPPLSLQRRHERGPGPQNPAGPGLSATVLQAGVVWSSRSPSPRLRWPPPCR